MSERPLFEDLKTKLLKKKGVEEGTMMGFSCLRIHKEFFASTHRETGNLIIKLPAFRVDELIQQDKGHPFAPNGRRFKEWIEISNRDKVFWNQLMLEALEFVSIKISTRAD